MKHLLLGARIVFGDPRFRPYVWKPLLISGFVFILAIILGFAIAVPAFGWLGSTLGVAAVLGGALGAILYGVGLWFLGSVVFISIAFTVSAFMWERLSFEVEDEVFGGAPRPKHPPSRLLLDSMQRIAMATSLLCCVGILNFIIPVLPSIVIGAWLGMHDFTSPALARRNIFLRHQLKYILRAKGWWSFALVAGIISIVPFLNIVLLPAFVAGGTLLICESEGKISRATLG